MILIVLLVTCDANAGIHSDSTRDDNRVEKASPKFLSFTIKARQQLILVQWSASNAGGRQFEIQRSENGSAWTTIGLVDAVDKTGNYCFADKNCTGKTIYYRVRVLDAGNLNPVSATGSIKGEIPGISTRLNLKNPIPDLM